MFHVEQSTATSTENCPVCGNSEFVTYLTLDDYFLTHETFTIIKCKNCGLLSTSPHPSPDEIGKYYDSPDYISHSTNKKSIKDRLYNIIRNRTLISKKVLLDKYAKGNRLLDIGCAIGVFLDYCQRNGYSTMGVEPDEKCRMFAEKNFHLQVKDIDALKQFPSKSFDIITMWHVLEHVDDLNERMSLIKKILADDGVLIIALPNPLSFDAKYYGKYWAAYDVPRHLYHFSKDAFEKLCNRFSFKIINIIPMVYDSFYISMLSEKYKNGTTSLVKAFFIGLKSNLKARSCKNHSSLIYIIRNK